MTPDPVPTSAGTPHVDHHATHHADHENLIERELSMALAPELDIDPGEESFPTFSEQVAQQLGGARGMVESSIPVIAFVVANLLWSLRPALILAIATALAIAGFRLSRRQSVRHAVNGLFGIALGALIAWRTGSPKDFYVPGIYMSLGYAVAMIASVTFQRPLVGWIWSVIADGGGNRWRTEPGLRRIFGWLTMLWAAIYLGKTAIQAGVYFADALSEDEKAGILGVIRIVLGFPPYALLLAVTIWSVRRHLRLNPPAVATS